MIVEIREEARGDLHAGYRFYEGQAAGLGRFFLECIFADIEPFHCPKDGAEEIVVEDIAFEGGAHEGSLHPCAFMDHGRARLCGEGNRVSLFPAALCVG